MAGQVELLELTEQADAITAPVFYLAQVAMPLPLGDLLGNGRIDSTCARMVLQYEVGLITLTPAQIAAGKVTGEKELCIADARAILQKLVGKITKFPVE